MVFRCQSLFLAVGSNCVANFSVEGKTATNKPEAARKKELKQLAGGLFSPAALAAAMQKHWTDVEH